MAYLICSSVGSGSSAMSAAPAMTMPGMQKAALHGAHGAKGVHEGLAHVLGQALDGHDVATGGKSSGQYARLDGRTVHVDGAGTARALGAAVLGGVNVQVVAQVAQQRFVLGRRALDAVNGKSEFLCHGDSLLHAGGDAGAVVDRRHAGRRRRTCHTTGSPRRRYGRSCPRCG